MELDRVLETSLTYFLNKLERGSVVPELEAAWNTIVEVNTVSCDL